MSLWNCFSENFERIINDIEEYNKILNFCIDYNYNLLLYSSSGFPFDLFIDEIIKAKFKLNNIYKKEHIWNKSIIYNENQYFFEIDLNNPNMGKKLSDFDNMLLSIIKTTSITNHKHLIIIKNIDKLVENFFSFRIILEKFYNNCYFICTTNYITKIETPIKSRFNLFRFRLFTNNEIQMIFTKYLNRQLNNYLIQNNCRDIYFAIFIGQVEINEPLLISEVFCNYNYPPIVNFINSNYNSNDVRQLAYKYSQYDLDIKDLILDLLKINKKQVLKLKILEKGLLLDQLLTKSNKGREPIYIETLLNQLLF
jgi:DNA polymerase III delta prime subunit